MENLHQSEKNLSKCTDRRSVYQAYQASSLGNIILQLLKQN